MSNTSSSQGYFGQRGRYDGTSLFAQIGFLVRQALAKTRTGHPVKIVAVHGGGVGPPPTVDVQMLVKQMDGVGNASSHSTIYGIPVKRNQGGVNAVINDPVVGDVGYLAVADRDISSVIANGGAEANPGSYRRHNISDGVYQGFMIKPITPTQYLQFRSDGVTLQDKNGNSIVTAPGKITVTAGGITHTFDSAGFHSGADVMTKQATTLETHTHAGGPPPDPGS